MKWIIDLCLLAILLICVWTGYKKGLVMGIGGMVVIIVSLYVGCLVSATFSYEIVPAVRPFASGYVERQMNTSVLEQMGLANTELSLEDILNEDPTLRHEFCFESYQSVGIYDDAAEQMATEAEAYAATNEATIKAAIVEVLCSRVTYVLGVALVFVLVLIILTAIGNLTNLTFKIPNMDRLNDIGGTVLGLVKGVTFCILVVWFLRFAGLAIGRETLGSTILGRLFLALDVIKLAVGI